MKKRKIAFSLLLSLIWTATSMYSGMPDQDLILIGISIILLVMLSFNDDDNLYTNVPLKNTI